MRWVDRAVRWMFVVCPVLLQAYSSGPPNGYTGAPGDLGICTACHGAPGSQGSLNIVFPGSTYTAQDTVLVSVVLTDPQASRWGFELVALDGNSATAASAGTLVPADGTTQISTSGSRTYIKHTSGGTYPGQTLQAQWTFFWIAPATGGTPVYFYAAGNAANGDGSTGGDLIYSTSAVLQPVGVQESPVPHVRSVHLKIQGRRLWLSGRGHHPVQVVLINPVGREVVRWRMRPGERVDLPLIHGVYMIHVEGNPQPVRVVLP